MSVLSFERYDLYNIMDIMDFWIMLIEILVIFGVCYQKNSNTCNSGYGCFVLLYLKYFPTFLKWTKAYNTQNFKITCTIFFLHYLLMLSPQFEAYFIDKNNYIEYFNVFIVHVSAYLHLTFLQHQVKVIKVLLNLRENNEYSYYM